MCAELGKIPTIWKTSTIVPIAKSRLQTSCTYIPCHEVFEKIIKDEMVSLTDGKLDTLQFAYQAGKGVDDANLFILQSVQAPRETKIPCKDFICRFFFCF